MGHVWDLYGTYAIPLWDMYGTYMGHMPYMGHVWDLYGTYAISLGLAPA
jgi:hypothetical protein